MKLILENIGMLKKAELTLSPLCLIAGENDQGKSTVGKVLFCIIKAINRYEEDLESSNEKSINRVATEIYFQLRKSFTHISEKQNLYLKNFHQQILRANTPEQKNSILKIELDNLLKREIISQTDTEKIQTLLKEIQQIVDTPSNSKENIAIAFTRVFASEFDSQIIRYGTEKGSIKLIENNLPLLNLSIDINNKITVNNEIEPIELVDATFIETPMIMNYHDLLIRSKTQLNINQNVSQDAYTTLHTKDFFDKLRQFKYFDVFFYKTNTELINKINEIIDGSIEYDTTKSDFVYKKNNQNIPIKNTASGIKTFGFLQILLHNSTLNKNALLIFDEPENHLHPKWQIKLAQVLVEMAASGIFILVSSHSPYIIEALERYSELQDNKELSRFYLAQENKIQDTNNLEEIFSILSEPFEIFRQMDQKALKDE